ncbi:hypothetical protein G9A89_023422 [Geosiphon pyriformis]|nr:hypothetical protein G9A89_023422 [Geosiphon pyriformis]
MPKPTKGNEYFFDRDGHVFHYIMQYYCLLQSHMAPYPKIKLKDYYHLEKKIPNVDINIDSNEMHTGMKYAFFSVRARDSYDNDRILSQSYLKN